MFALPLALFGKWLDGYRKATVLLYSSDVISSPNYKKICSAFQVLASCDRTWHIPSAGRINTLTAWKRNSGASYVVIRNAIKLATSLPKFIRCNIDVPCIPIGQRHLYFYPNFLMVCEQGKVGAINYDELRIKNEKSIFLEENYLPKDTKVIDFVWKYPNINGSPDSRFNNNKQIPRCLYETMHLLSGSGLNEVIEFSCFGHGNLFINSIYETAKIHGNMQKQQKINYISK